MDRKTAFVRVLASALGVGLAANALAQLVAPLAWYGAVPGVTATGPFNAHFVRDIGCAYAAVGIALCVAAEIPSARRGVLYGTTLFYGFHALLHVADLTAGRLPPDHWLVDLPGVFLPAILFAVLCLPRFHRA